MRKYNQLSQKEREIIDVLKREGQSCDAIGKKLNRHKSTIARELERNSSVSINAIWLIEPIKEPTKGDKKLSADKD